VLQDQYVTAGLAEYAQGMGQAQEGTKGLLEELNGEKAQVVGDPIVERLAEEFAEHFRVGSAGADSVR
jgi:hypothetical protein